MTCNDQWPDYPVPFLKRSVKESALNHTCSFHCMRLSLLLSTLNKLQTKHASQIYMGVHVFCLPST